MTSRDSTRSAVNRDTRLVDNNETQTRLASIQEAANFEALAAAADLPLKADLYIQDEDADAFFAHGPSVDATGLVHQRGIKLYMDGALGSRGAALLAPYADAPGNGLLVTPLEHMRDIVRSAPLSREQAKSRAQLQVIDQFTLPGGQQ